jgi:hypothetical protein
VIGHVLCSRDQTHLRKQLSLKASFVLEKMTPSIWCRVQKKVIQSSFPVALHTSTPSQGGRKYAPPPPQRTFKNSSKAPFCSRRRYQTLESFHLSDKQTQFTEFRNESIISVPYLDPCLAQAVCRWLPTEAARVRQ